MAQEPSVRRLLAALWLAAAPMVAGAQTEPSAPPAPLSMETDPIREEVRLVLFPTTVTDRRGRPVQGLERDDFRLTEAGTSRDIDIFATERDLPISLAFVLDVSGSMGLGGKLERSKRAIRTFVEALGPDDRMGLICFADDQVTWVTEFTGDRARFLRRLEVQTAEGRTALYDALAASPGLVDAELKGRKAIVLFTDGLDNASALGTLNAVWLARRVPVPIHLVNFIPFRQSLSPIRVRKSLRVLKRFSAETGGQTHPIHDPRDLDRAVARIQEQMRFQYVIGYYASDSDWDGSFRPVRLDTDRPGLRIRTRRGFYANR